MLHVMRTLLLLIGCGFASTSWAEAPTAVTASAGVGFLNRSFSWAGDAAGVLSSSSQPFAGAVAVDASWFPGAHVTEGAGSWFGLFGQGEFGLGMASQLGSTGAVFAHSASRLRTGALARLPLGERFSLLVHAGYGWQSFSTSNSAVVGSAVRPNAPDVLFEGPRGGAGARVKLGSSAELEVLAGFQYVTGLGELGSAAWFPNATAFAMDAGLGVSIGLVEHVRVRVSGQWQRTFVTLDGNGTYQAASAAEQYVGGAVSLLWVM